MAEKTVKNQVNSVMLEFGMQRRIQATVLGSTLRRNGGQQHR